LIGRESELEGVSYLFEEKGATKDFMNEARKLEEKAIGKRTGGILIMRML
jgi:hypothetical protein